MLRNRNDDIIGSAEFPTSSAGTGRVEVDPITGKPDGWRCQECGMWCNSDRVQSSGTANSGDGNILNDSTTGDPTVTRGGCPFCGTGNSKR